jgi:hypothetical protein
VPGPRVAVRFAAPKASQPHFDPHLVICSLPATARYGDIVCWVQLSLECPSQPSVVCIDGRFSEHNNPTLEQLLRVLDEVEQLL